MNINKANTAINNVNNTPAPPAPKANQAFAAPKGGAPSVTNPITVSNNAKVSSHLDSLSNHDKAEVKAFMQNLAQQGGNLNAQLSKAPQSVKSMAQKLDMNLTDLSAAMPKESPNKPGNSVGAKGVAAYNSVAAQATSAPTPNGLKANKPLAA